MLKVSISDSLKDRHVPLISIITMSCCVWLCTITLERLMMLSV